MLKYLLFDLDGTLTDPRIGITKSVQYALKSFGIEEEDLTRLEPFIGPPLMDSFMEQYHMSAEQAAQAVVKYRERFAPIGVLENEIIPGIPEMLVTLKKADKVLAVASSKPITFVNQILKHFEILQYFDVVGGSELDGSRGTKEEVVEDVLTRIFGEEPVRTEETAMIGDRKFDIQGAKAYGLVSVGVTFGFAPRGELKAARADYIARDVKQLTKILLE